MSKFDIVKMIGEMPIALLTLEYKNILIDKIRDKFTAEEQQLFVANFFCYLNYSTK
jgi:hypothetical protein